MKARRVPAFSPASATARSPMAPRLLVGSVLVGVGAGIGGAALTLLLHAVQHVAFGYTEQTFLIGVERASGLRRVLAMMFGGAVVGFGWWLHRRGVTDEDVSVTHALRDRDGPRLPLLATTADAVLQIVAVGAGASLGREGAPRQTGAAIAGVIADRLGLSVSHRRTLLACGAGAGLAAVYNVPLGGAVFTAEVLLTSMSVEVIASALLSAGVSTVVAWPVLSRHATYQLSPVRLHAPVVVWALLLGPLVGVVGVAFVRLMTAARTHAARGWRLAITVPAGFAAVGTLAIAYPQLLGNGKGATELAFTGGLSIGLAAALALLKPLATAACLGSGAIGGLLTPALATGAALGVFGGRIWDHVWPGSSIVEYAVVGAAALLAVTQRAPVTAIVLTLELIATGLALTAPMLIAVLGASVTAGLIDRDIRPLGWDAARTRAQVFRRPGIRP